MSQPDCPNREETDKSLGWLERIVRKRFGLLLLVALLGWPLLGFIPALEPLVANGMLLDQYHQLAFLALTNVVAFFFSFAILRLLNARLPGGWCLQWIAGDGNTAWSRSRITGTWLSALMAPTILAVFFASEFPGPYENHLVKAFGTIILSATFALGGLMLLGILKGYLVGSDKDIANYFPFEARSQNGILPWAKYSPKLMWLQRFGIEPVDWQFLIYLVLLAVAHGGLLRFLESGDYWLTSVPSMLVLLIWLMFMTLAGIANVLDRWRLPVLILSVLLLATILGLRGATRRLETVPDLSLNRFVQRVATVRQRESKLLDSGGTEEDRRALVAQESALLEQNAWQAISSRMQKVPRDPHGKGKTLVVVTCPGGGIHAAAWAACVLDQLTQEYVEFKDSVCVISGVSGGSVGTLFFVNNRYHAELLGANLMAASPSTSAEVHHELMEKSPALELAARSSLEAIAFGISVEDLYGPLGPLNSGRGQRLENSFSSRLPKALQSLTMGQWGDLALAGAIPIVVFNATDAVTGRRILFDTIPTPLRSSSIGLTARPLNYRELLDATVAPYDVRPSTAARVSATFPYVSPFTKPDRPSAAGQSVALCDGGYVDNEGIVSAVNWIEFLLRRWSSEPLPAKTFDRILLLRIQPSVHVDRNQMPDAGGAAGFLRWLTGPVETMVKVRSASQLERGNLEADLVSLFLESANSLRQRSATASPPSGTSWGANSATAQTNVEDVIPEFDPRTQEPEAIRQNWEEMLDKFEKDSSVQLPPSLQQPPAFTAFQGTDPPVISLAIPFVDANQAIPLNWKLSNRQKKAYLLAWSLRTAPGTQLRLTLDRYFTRSGQ